MNQFLLLVTKTSAASGVHFNPIIFLLYIVIPLFFIIRYRKKLIKNYKLTLGVIFSLLGSLLTIFLSIQRNTTEYQLASAFGAEEATIIDVLFYIGIVALIAGVAFIIAHFKKRDK